MRAERSESNRQGLKGSADLAFTLKIRKSQNKAKLFVGLVLEHSKLNPYVSLALVAMKYVFNAEKYKPLMDKAMTYFLDPKNKVDDSFFQEVFLYLGEETSSEYREAIMDRPEIMAERKRNGFKSVADVLRAEGRDEERRKADAEKLEAAREMLRDGDSIEKICRILKLSEEQIAGLKN